MESIVRGLFSSRQAQAATVGYLILFFSVIVTMFQNKSITAEGETYELSTGEIILALILILIGYMLSIFSINCMVEGQSGIPGCSIWAWVNSAIVLVFAAAIIFAMIFRITV